MKKYAGWTEKRWREEITWVLTTHLWTTGSKAAYCHEKRRQLMLVNDWDNLPIDIKYNIEFYAYLHEKYGGGEPIKKEKQNDGGKG
jgi:hypothetical protein